MNEWWNKSPRISARELALVALAAILIAVVQFWPLILNLGSDIPLDLGDPLPQAWQVAWDGHALLNQPLSFFQSNQFWPQPDTLAYSEALIGYTPAGIFGTGPQAAVARYDLLFLFAFALPFFAAYLLARELGAPRWAALVAGAAFAYAPWRMEQGGHLHVISSGGIPLTFALLLRGYRRQSAALIFGGWAVASWQLSLGFSLGLQLLYLLALIGAVLAFFWWRAGRPLPTRRVVLATLGGCALLVVVGFVLSRPYMRVLADHPEAARSAAIINHYSPPLKGFLVAPKTSLIWGDLTAPIRGAMPASPEKTLFLGLAIMLLAAIGLTWRGYPRGLRIGLFVAACTFAVLSLGFRQVGIGQFLPYRLIYEFLPGWQGIRVSGRLHTLTTLAMALLAAGGAARLAAAAASHWRREWLAAASAALLTLIVLVEGSGIVYPHPRVPLAPSGLAGLQPPLLLLPSSPEDNRRYLIWSTAGFPPMLNGRTSFEPRFLRDTLRSLRHFEDPSSIETLRRIGVRTVVVDTAEHGAGRWARGAAGLPASSAFSREWRRPLLILKLRPLATTALSPKGQ